MKNKFEHLKLPNEKETKKLWEECVFVFDTNVLLNLYRYSDKTKNDFINILESIQDRIWIPYQVGFEYQNNRIGLIEGQIAKYDNFLNNIKTALSNLKKEITEKKSHPYIDSKIIDDISSIIEKESVNIIKEKNKVEKLINKDSIEIDLNRLFNNNVGEQFPEKILKEILIEGEYRYNNKIPPGYKDLENKSSIRKYGDLIIWFEIIEKSKLIEKPILFVTDDLKEDWWKTSNKNKIPRLELTQEFYQKCNQKFFMYHSDEFMRLSEKYLDQNVNPKSIEEVKETRVDKHNLQINNNVNTMMKNSFIHFLKNEYIDNFKTTISNQKSSTLDTKLIENIWNDFIYKKINKIGKDSKNNESEDTSVD